MRSNFTYALNEDGIRRQLQEQTAPLKEEAWQRFSAYSEAHTRPVAVRKFPQVKINISRKLVVPVAAGLTLILVTVLLVNMITLKTAGKKTAASIQTTEPFVPLPQISEPETLMSMAQRSQQKETALPENVPATQPDKPQLTADKSAAVPQQKNPQSPTGSQPLTGEPQATVEAKKKTRVQAPDLEAVQLQDIRPTILSAEQEEEIRPN